MTTPTPFPLCTRVVPQDVLSVCGPFLSEKLALHLHASFFKPVVLGGLVEASGSRMAAGAVMAEREPEVCAVLCCAALCVLCCGVLWCAVLRYCVAFVLRLLCFWLALFCRAVLWLRVLCSLFLVVLCSSALCFALPGCGVIFVAFLRFVLCCLWLLRII